MFMLYSAQNLSLLNAEVTLSQSLIVKFHKINLYFGNINFQQCLCSRSNKTFVIFRLDLDLDPKLWIHLPLKKKKQPDQALTSTLK